MAPENSDFINILEEKSDPDQKIQNSKSLKPLSNFNRNLKSDLNFEYTELPKRLHI